MEEKSEKRTILIVSGYHQKESFAVGVGELLLEKIKNPDIKVVRYRGKQDKNSTYYLRRFVEESGQAILPIVLHNDDEFDMKIDSTPSINAIILYYAKSEQEKKKILKPLFDFILKYNRRNALVIFDIVLTNNAKHSLIEIELNPKMGLKKAVNLVSNFSEYLLNSLK